MLLTILRNLDKKSFYPVVACPNGTLAERCEQLGISKIEMQETYASFTSNPIKLACSLVSIFGRIKELRKIVQTTRPSLIHANTIRSGIPAAIVTLGMGIPVIWHLHDLLPRNITGNSVRLLAYLCSHISVSAVSHATEKNFRLRPAERMVRKLPIATIYNSVNELAFYPDASTRMRVRADLQLSETEIAVCIIGQLTKRKQQLELLQAFLKYFPSAPRIKIFIIGTAMFREENRTYQQQIDDFIQKNRLEEQVKRLGARSDIAELLNGMDIAVLNSTEEPFGLALAEALATELPVVAPAHTGFLEVVHDQVTGLLADDTDTLVRHILLLAQNSMLRNTMGKQGRIEMMERFPESLQIEALQDEYRRRLAESRGAAQ